MDMADLRWGCVVGIGDTWIANTNAFSTTGACALLMTVSVSNVPRRTRGTARLLGSCEVIGWLYDVLVWDSDPVWRTRITDHSSTFPRPCQSKKTVKTKPIVSGTSLKINGNGKTPSIPAMMFPHKEAYWYVSKNFNKGTTTN